MEAVFVQLFQRFQCFRKVWTLRRAGQVSFKPHVINTRTLKRFLETMRILLMVISDNDSMEDINMSSLLLLELVECLQASQESW